MARDGKDIPLVTDLDGTLVAGDTLVEGVKDLLARRPWMCCVLPFWVAPVSYKHLRAHET